MMDKINISIEEALDLMRKSESIEFYEYYNGIEVNDCNIIKCKPCEFESIQKSIFEMLPDTNLISFGYTSRFPSETCFSHHLVNIPQTLRVLTLANFHGVDVNKLAHLECHHQNEEYYADDGIDIKDDTGKYTLMNNMWRSATNNPTKKRLLF